ncbi:MAG: heme exporter protein CcmD [Sulfuritalea sp.]|nr:heme exporter protein CcmD [Sulfuritalea sp.]MDP1981234.1 heme exporter protein CcmD [Sulfuritalea sp.]
MQWTSVGEFFAMGGYALYVWGSFGACALLMSVEPFLAKRRLSEVRKSLARERLADQLELQQKNS